MGLIGGIARHGAATLHALLVVRHSRHTVRKLQTQQASDGHHDEQSFPHTPIDATQIGRARQQKDTGNLPLNENKESWLRARRQRDVISTGRLLFDTCI